MPSDETILFHYSPGAEEERNRSIPPIFYIGIHTTAYRVVKIDKSANQGKETRWQLIDNIEYYIDYVIQDNLDTDKKNCHLCDIPRVVCII